MPETERELHAEFFGQWSNDEESIIDTLDETALTARRNELAKICLEAKVRIVKDEEKLRKIKAERTKSNKPWLVGVESIDVSLAPRKERMSKLDKTRALLAKFGMEGTEDIISAVVKKESGGSVSTTSDRVMIDRAPSNLTIVKQSTNTQESLLNDLSKNIRDGLDTMKIDDLYKASVTAGHIGNRLLGVFVDESKFDFSFLKD